MGKKLYKVIRRTTACALAFAMLCGLSGCSAEKEENLLVADVSYPEGYGFDDYDTRREIYRKNSVSDSFVDSVNGFSCETAYELLKEDGNICYSPISLYSTNSIEIPVTASNLERTGAIIEALSAESYYSLTPAYYETVLKTKGARDLESGDMLDVIFASRIYDLAYMYNWGDIVGSIGGLKIGGMRIQQCVGLVCGLCAVQTDARVPQAGVAQFELQCLCRG